MSGTVERQVTLAQLSTQIAVLSTQLKNIRELLETANLSRQDHEDRIRDLEKSNITLKERMNILAGINSVLALIGSAIAAFIGVR